MSETAAGGSGTRAPAWTAAAVVLAAIAFAAAVRFRLADTPLERDEGEYAYAGRLILAGTPPYRLACNMKFPGTYYAYAAILAVFGRTAWGVHAGLAVVNAASTWLVFRLGRRVLGEFAGAVAATGFALLTLDRWIMGVWGHATHFVALPVVAALLVLLRAGESRRRSALLAGGALLGVAVVMKQHAIFFVPLGAALALRDGLRREPRDARAAVYDAAIVVAGAAVPFASVVALCAWQGVLGRFWFWTFVYAGRYVTETPASLALDRLSAGFGTVVRATYPLWFAAGAGFVALWTDRRNAGARAVVGGLAAAAALAACPGFWFRPHYFIVLVPAAALCLGVASLWIERTASGFVSPRAARWIAAAVFAALAVRYVAAERTYLFAMSPAELSRSRYGTNPFVEAPEIARYINAHTGPDDRVAVLGSEPEILFLADRVGATGCLHTYALMEPQPFAAQMQDEMIRDIESSRPAYVVDVQIASSWLVGPDSDRRIFDWRERYVPAHYDLVGVADIGPLAETRVVWDDDVRSYAPAFANRVLTYRRRD